MAQFRTPAVLAAIEQHGIADIVVVPSMLQSLLDEPAFAPERVQSLARIAFGAAPIPPDLLDRALAAWPGAEFFQAYGLTETAGAVCINLPANHRPKPRSNPCWRTCAGMRWGSTCGKAACAAQGHRQVARRPSNQPSRHFGRLNQR